MVNRANFAPPPGVILGETDFSIPGQWCAGNNVRFVNGKAQPIGGWTDLLSGAHGITGNAVAMLEWAGKDGTRRVAVGATGSLRLYSGSLLTTAATITPASFSSSTSNRWTFDLWGDHLIACLSGSGVYETLAFTGNITPVTNAPTTNTIALVTGTRQLMVLGTKEETSGTFNPRCIRWSHTEDNTQWTTLPSNLAGEYILDGAGGGIKAAKKIGDYIAVWTDDELFLGSFTGDPNNPWVFQRQANGCGCGGTDAVTIADGAAYWVTPDARLMGWIPGAPPFELPGVPKYYIRGTSTLATAALAFVWHNRAYNEVWFHLSTNSTYPSAYLAVSVPSLQSDRPVWFPGNMSRACMYQGLNGCYGWDWANSKLLKHENSNEGASGESLSWSLQSLVYFDQGERRVQVNRLLPDIEAQVGDITCEISSTDYPQGAEVVKSTLTLAAGDDKKDFRASGKLFRLALSGSTTTFARLGKMTFEFVMQGGR